MVKIADVFLRSGGQIEMRGTLVASPGTRRDAGLGFEFNGDVQRIRGNSENDAQHSQDEQS